MKRAYAKSQYAKPYESYCREQYPNEAEQIFREAGRYYLEFMKDMPDLGENIMAKNISLLILRVCAVRIRLKKRLKNTVLSVLYLLLKEQMSSLL